MFRHRKETTRLWLRKFVIDFRSMAVCSLVCERCKSTKVTGDEKSWSCEACGLVVQSS